MSFPVPEAADEGSEDRKEQVAIMKGYADAVLSVWQRLSYFSLEAKNLDDIPTDEDVIFMIDSLSHMKDRPLILSVHIMPFAISLHGSLMKRTSSN